MVSNYKWSSRWRNLPARPIYNVQNKNKNTMEYTIDFQKTYKPSAKSIEFGTTTIVVACCEGNEPYLFTFCENANNNGKITGREGQVEISVNIGEATIEELIDAYFNVKYINGVRWRYIGK